MLARTISCQWSRMNLTAFANMLRAIAIVRGQLRLFLHLKEHSNFMLANSRIPSSSPDNTVN